MQSITWRSIQIECVLLEGLEMQLVGRNPSRAGSLQVMLPLQIEEPGLEMFLKNVFQCCCSLLRVVELFEICFHSTWLFKKLLVEHTALLVELL